MYKYILIIFCLYFTSCELEEVIPWEGAELERNFLVVEGVLTTDSIPQMIRLTYSDSYFSSVAPQGVSNADVIIGGGGAMHGFVESDTAAGLYVAQDSFIPEIGVEYSLSVHLDEPLEEENHFVAKTKVNPTMRIDTMVAVGYENPFAGYDPEDSTVWVMMHMLGLEPPDMDNYYVLKFWRNDTLRNDTLTSYQLLTDFDFEIDGHTSFSIPVYSVPYVLYDTLEVEVYSVPQDYYDYIAGCQIISQPADPFGFSGTPANVIGNVNDGDALGFFYGTSVARAKSVIIPDSVYNLSPLFYGFK